MNQKEQYKNLSWLTKIRCRLRDRSGQSTTEYILILAIVVLIAGKMRTKLNASIDTTITKLDGAINEINVDR